MGYFMGMKTVKFGNALLSLFALNAVVGAESPTSVDYVDGERVFIKNPIWHPKDEGAWLFTCRLEAAADRLVKPVAHLHFFSEEGEGEGEEAEIIWEHKAIVRRSKFDKSYGSRKASFIRVLLNDLPPGLESMTVEFKNNPPNADTAE
jgi:hypothetical protein